MPTGGRECTTATKSVSNLERKRPPNKVVGTMDVEDIVRRQESAQESRALGIEGSMTLLWLLSPRVHVMLM